MKALLFPILLFSLDVFALDISFPEPTGVSESEAWKYGITASKKKIDVMTYMAIEINEKLLCPVKEVRAYANRYENVWEELTIVKAEKSYGVSIKTGTRSTVNFVVRCNKISNVHENDRFSYEFYL